MSIDKCAILSCDNPALIGTSTCTVCSERLCGIHHDDLAIHDCSVNQDHWLRRMGKAHNIDRDALIAKIDVLALAAEAASLRPGHACTGPDQSDIRWIMDLFGHGCNIHLPLTFDDGVKWVVRIRRRRAMAPCLPALRMNMECEAVTLRVLKDAGVVVPGAWTSVSSNHGDLVYFFEEFVLGQPKVELQSLKIRDPDETTIRCIRQIAGWFISLSSILFNQTGSLHQTPGSDTHYVGPLIDRWHTYSSSPYYTGPFPTAKARYLCTIDDMLQQTRDGVRYCQSQSLIGYLALLEARCLVDGCEGLEEGEYYIKHGEDKGEIFFFDGDNNLSGVLDWEWSYITSKNDAFAAPYGFPDREFRNGENELCPRERVLLSAYEDLGRPDLAQAVRGGKRFQRLANLLRATEFRLSDLNALRRAFLDIPDGISGEPVTMDEWILATRRRFEGEGHLEAMWPTSGGDKIS